MKIYSVEICNYKSIGDSDNKIILDPAVTAIIGKNESGKSNVLYSLRTIRFLSKDKDVFKEINQNRNSGVAISFKVVLKSDGDIGLPDEETMVYISESEYSVQGGLFSYYNSEIKTEIKTFVEFIEKNLAKFKGINRDEINSKCANLKLNTLNVPLVNETINQFKKWENNVDIVIKDEFKKLLGTIETKWQILINDFPQIFYRDDRRNLLNEYQNDVLKNELNKKDSFLVEFFKFLGFTPEDIKKVTGANNTADHIRNLKRKIIKAINKKINEPFKKFYSTEEIILDAEFQQNSISFYVQSTDGATMGLSERSDGLRWYLNMFIDAQMHSLSNRNVVYLFDEPGIHLHVNAQKELLKLFDDLASKGNQIVYTTHSPYMLNPNELSHVRAVVKDETGNTKIYKTPYDSKIAPNYQNDTIAPLLAALGMDFGDTIGPAYGKLNIITEGASDTYYLTAMAKKLQLDVNKYAFIPSVGASNCINMCLMLHGWGCKSVVLFDYDKGGVESGGQRLKNDYEYECGRDYLYIKDCSQKDIDEKEYKHNGKCIEDLVTDLQEFLNTFGYSQNTSKTLNAKLYADAIQKGTYKCPQETLGNFKELFDRIDACASLQKV